MLIPAIFVHFALGDRSRQAELPGHGHLTTPDGQDIENIAFGDDDQITSNPSVPVLDDVLVVTSGGDEDGRLARRGTEEKDEKDEHTARRSPRKQVVFSRKTHRHSPTNHLDPPALPIYRFTPILSGIIIPFSILLEIPGLTEHWYIRTEGNDIVETKPNTPILITGMAISMACGVLANACLVGRFLEREQICIPLEPRFWTWFSKKEVKGRVGNGNASAREEKDDEPMWTWTVNTGVKVTTIWCIFFLTIHDIINILIVTIFGVEHRFHDGFTYGPSFWMTLCSTVVSSFTNATLIVDLCRTPNFPTSGSGLTKKQRSLVIVVILLLSYIALGAWVTSSIMDLNFVNALYFAVVSIETIGLGDIYPRTTGSRVFMCFYSIFGILNLALAIGLMRETVLEALEESYRRRVQKYRQRLRERQEEKRSTERKKRIGNRWLKAIQWRLGKKGMQVWVPDDGGSEKEGRKRGAVVRRICGEIWQPFWRHLRDRYPYFGESDREALFVQPRGPPGMKLNLDPLSRAELESASLEAGIDLELLVGREYWAARFGGPGVDTGAGHIGDEKGKGRDVEKGMGGMRTGADQMPLTHARLGRMMLMIGNVAMAVDHSMAEEGQRYWRGKVDGRQTQAGPALTEVPTMESVDVDGPTQGEVEHEATQDDDPERAERRRVKAWGKSVADGMKGSLADQYESFRTDMEKEERYAFYARFIVAWTLFTIFWVVGSVIFMETEEWSFGLAIYFCFISFTTIGYGDIAPKSPAGRAIYVFWALLGVGTMTVLISIISEVYSTRYKSIVNADVFKQAVERYSSKQKRLKEEESNLSHRSQTLQSLSGPDPSQETQDGSGPFAAASSSTQRASSPSPQPIPSKRLISVSYEVLERVRDIEECLRFLVAKPDVSPDEKIDQKRQTASPRRPPLVTRTSSHSHQTMTRGRRRRRPSMSSRQVSDARLRSPEPTRAPPDALPLGHRKSNEPSTTTGKPSSSKQPKKLSTPPPSPHIPGIDEIIMEIVDRNDEEGPDPPWSNTGAEGQASVVHSNGIRATMGLRKRRTEKEKREKKRQDRERMERRMRQEIMQNEDARKMLLVLSIEASLKRMIEVAEETLDKFDSS